MNDLDSHAKPRPINPRHLLWSIPAVLVALVSAVFGRALWNGFVAFDDNIYIYQNPVVMRGITASGLRWAFVFAGTGHWHPLTWISHMLDCQLYGLWPGGHHLTSLLFHAASSVLLFLILSRMTGALWRSAFATAIWAIHPLRVESVVWAAERKDVLSAFFFMLTIGTYLFYLRRASVWRYLAVSVVYLAGLLSKDMLVTLPFVLLLLDYWPLARFHGFSGLQKCVVEKIPWFILSAASCVATILSPEKVDVPSGGLLWTRVGNAAIAASIYLRQSFWPAGLGAFYPYPLHPYPNLWVLPASLLFLALTIAALLLRGTSPYLVVGWFWFLGMLVPVLGFVEPESFVRADRYTYLPQIGLIICVVWLLGDWAGNAAARRVVVAGVGGAMICGFSIVAFRQAGYWHDSETLWTRAISVNPSNYVARSNLGNWLLEQHAPVEAIAQFQQAVAIAPNYAPAYLGMGSALLSEDKLNDATAAYQKAVNLRPSEAEYRGDLGAALMEQGKANDGMAEFREGVRLNPLSATLHFDQGLGLMQQKRVWDAIAEYRKAAELDPGYAAAHENLANALLDTHDVTGAIAQYREATLYAPGYAGAHYGLGRALEANRDDLDAIAEMKRAVELSPDNIGFANDLAWLLATASQSSARDGNLAMELAIRTTRATSDRDPSTVRVLAAAYAQAGDFKNAIDAAQSAQVLAQKRGDAELASTIQRETDRYRQGLSFPANP